LNCLDGRACSNAQDPQLEKALELVMKAIQENPKKLPARPPDLPEYPDDPGV
jgi:hypothetical protein